MRWLLSLLLSSFLVTLVHAAEQPLLVVGGDSISADEFLYLWRKHNSYKGESKPETMRSFLETYTNYRLKVLDAKAQGLQKRSSFLNEYQQYRDVQLTPYFLDSAERERLYHAAYERMKWEVDASHILLSVPADSEDSVVYNRALELRQRLLHGASFDSLARAVSDDPSAATNGGNLGFFGASTMVYPFELAAYNTPVDSISLPVRTSFGYHLIRVNNRRPDRGSLTVAHIFRVAREPISPERDREIRDTMLLIRSRILDSGESFFNLVQDFSQDANSAAAKGLLPPVTTGRFPASFADAAFALKHDGDISEPVRTRFGWHLIRRLRKDSVGSYEEARETIRRSLQRVGIELEGHDALVNTMLDRAKASLDEEAVSTLVGKNDSVRPAPTLLVRPFAHIGATGQELPLSVLYDYVVENKIAFDRDALMRAAKHLLDDTAFAYCEREVRAANPQLDYLLHEFYDGLLLFDISETKLWQTNPPESVYKSLYKKYKKELVFAERLHVEEYSTTSDVKKLSALHIKLCPSLKNKPSKKELLRDSITLRVSNYEAGTSYFSDYGKIHKSPSPVEWDGVCSMILAHGNRSFFFRVTEVRKNVPKSLDESRGELQRYYQTEEEQRWLTDLRKQYKIVVNEALLEQLEKSE
jgi:possible peptidyl-prolyl cis-trans isomerase